MWRENSVEKYEAWFKTPEGKFAFGAERMLLERLISGWPRRGHKLLEIGCGTGRFLDLFYHGGFDVSGIDPTPDMLAMARERMENRVDLHLGHADHLPFDDNEFDYAAMLTVLEFTPEPGKAVLEAARVARKGLLIGFLNKHSLYYLSHGLRFPFCPSKNMLRQARWFSPPQMRSLIQNTIGLKPIYMRAVLPGPKRTWRDEAPWKWVNGFMYPSPLGAYCAARVDFVDEKPLTPLWAPLKNERAEATGQGSF